MISKLRMAFVGFALLANANAQLWEETPLLPPSPKESLNGLLVHDLTGDGLPELIGYGALDEANPLYLFDNNGGGRFSLRPPISGIEFAKIWPVDVNDVDADGLVDIIVATTTTSPFRRGIAAMLQDSEGGFANSVTLIEPNSTIFRYVGLLTTKDGQLDSIVTQDLANEPAYTRYTQIEPLTFTSTQMQLPQDLPGDPPFSSELVDMTGNGLQDLVLYRNGSSVTVIYQAERGVFSNFRVFEDTRRLSPIKTREGTDGLVRYSPSTSSLLFKANASDVDSEWETVGIRTRLSALIVGEFDGNEENGQEVACVAMQDHLSRLSIAKRAGNAWGDKEITQIKGDILAADIDDDERTEILVTSSDLTCLFDLDQDEEFRERGRCVVVNSFRPHSLLHIRAKHDQEAGILYGTSVGVIFIPAGEIGLEHPKAYYINSDTSSSPFRLEDFDSDGQTEILQDNRILVGLGTSTAHFDVLGSGLPLKDAVIVDANEDGLEDVLYPLGSETAPRWYYYKNHGDGSYSSSAVPLKLSGRNWQLSNDIDGDGALDFISHHESEESIIGYNRGSFPPEPSIRFSGTSGNRVSFVDLRGDGHQDLIEWRRAGKIRTLVGWHPQSEDGTYQTASFIVKDRFGAQIDHAAISMVDGLMDVNGDGLLDLLRLNWWYKNQGDGTFLFPRVLVGEALTSRFTPSRSGNLNLDEDSYAEFVSDYVLLDGYYPDVAPKILIEKPSVELEIGEWFYARATVLDATDVEIRDAPVLSNDARLGMPHEDLTHQHAVTLLPEHQPWRVYLDAEAPPEEWKDDNFDDRSWRSVMGPFTNRELAGATNILEAGVSPETTAYFRARFYVPISEFDSSGFSKTRSVSLSIAADDDYVIYINGGHYFSSPGFQGLRHTLIKHETAALRSIDGSQPDHLEVIGLSGEQLREGWNSIAVQVHQASDGEDDLFMEASMVGLNPPLNQTVAVPVTATNAFATTSDTISVTYRRAPRISGRFSDDYWQIFPGDPVELSWRSELPGSLAITDAEGSFTSPVPAVGSTVIHPRYESRITLTSTNGKHENQWFGYLIPRYYGAEKLVQIQRNDNRSDRLVIGDLDADGDDDFLFQGRAYDSVYEPLPFIYTTEDQVLLDLDRDGKADLLEIQANSLDVLMLRNDGTQFGEEMMVGNWQGPSHPRLVHAIDRPVENLVGLLGVGGYLELLALQDDGSLKTTLRSTEYRYLGASCVDVDGDGFSEIIAHSEESVIQFRQSSAGIWSPPEKIFSFFGIQDVQLAHVDNDDVTDYVVLTRAGALFAFHSSGSGIVDFDEPREFNRSQPRIDFLLPSKDIDGNGKVDLLAASGGLIDWCSGVSPDKPTLESLGGSNDQTTFGDFDGDGDEDIVSILSLDDGRQWLAHQEHLGHKAPEFRRTSVDPDGTLSGRGWGVSWNATRADKVTLQPMNHEYSPMATVSLGDYEGTLRVIASNDFGTDEVELQIVTDRDSDGLPDAWELWFGNDLALSPDADDDGDGDSNFTEFLLGTAPTMAGEALLTLSADGRLIIDGPVGSVMELEQSHSMNPTDWHVINGFTLPDEPLEAWQVPALNVGSPMVGPRALPLSEFYRLRLVE